MASSLYDMSTRACIKNIIEIRDVGDLPYRVLRPILRKIPTPGQLADIEELSPHIAEQDAELWHAFIKRDIPNGESKIPENTPSDPTKWAKVYRKLKRADQRQQEAAEEQLKLALSGRRDEKARNQTKIIHAVIPQGKKPAFGGPRTAPSGVQALRNARTSADQLKILRRQTAKSHQGRAQGLNVPTHQLQQKLGTVQQAPRSMISQYTRTAPQIIPPKSASTTFRPTTTFAPRTSQASDRDRAINTAIIREQEEKERRLRALTGASASRNSSAAPQKSMSHPPPASEAHSSASQPALPQLQRKRPAYNPFMPAKKRKT